MKRLVLLISFLMLCSIAACDGGDMSNIDSMQSSSQSSTDVFEEEQSKEVEEEQSKEVEEEQSGETEESSGVESGADSSENSSSFTPITNGGNYTPDKNYK